MSSKYSVRLARVWATSLACIIIVVSLCMTYDSVSNPRSKGLTIDDLTQSCLGDSYKRDTKYCSDILSVYIETQRQKNPQPK